LVLACKHLNKGKIDFIFEKFRLGYPSMIRDGRKMGKNWAPKNSNHAFWRRWAQLNKKR